MKEMTFSPPFMMQMNLVRGGPLTPTPQRAALAALAPANHAHELQRLARRLGNFRSTLLEMGIDSDPLQWLVEPEKLSEFLKDTWEGQARLYRANEERKALFPNLSSVDYLKQLLDPGSEIQLDFGVDLNAARYKDGMRETLNAEEADLETVLELYDNGCTLQLHQPQRWNEELWQLISALETQLGCLVGSNAYLTPAGTQGLAPHYDDVNLWVCQTEGTKRWRIYKPVEGYARPWVPSKDFDESQIGEPIMDVTLQVGDVLYMPRGTIHQAEAQSEASCHLTISTYQKWTIADFALNLIQELQSGVPSAKGFKGTPILPADLSASLPLGFMYKAGIQAEALSKLPGAVARCKDNGIQVAKATAQGLRNLAEELETKSAQWTALVADRMAIDFLQSRAPPHPGQLPDRGSAPTFSSTVQSVGASYFRIVPCSPSPEVLDAYAGETSFVMVLSCLKNSIESHMMGAGKPEDVIIPEEDGTEEQEQELPNKKRKAREAIPTEEEDRESDDEEADEDEDDDSESESGSGDLVFPASYTTALAQLLQASEPVAVRDLKLGSKEERHGMAYSLWDEGLIFTVETTSDSKSGAKKQKV